MATIYNLGTRGAPINADTGTLIRVDGPNIWFPGTAGNDLTCPG